MSSNTKIALGLGVLFAAAAYLWWSQRVATAQAALSTEAAAGGTASRTGDVVRSIGAGLASIAGGIADAAAPSGSQ